MFRDGIESIFVGLQLGSSDLVMVLSAFFDESEHPTANDPFAVAGYVFKPTAYRQFARNWRDVLAFAGVDAMHMTDLVQGRREFKGQSMDKRATALQMAAKAIMRHMTAGIGVAFFQDEFEAVAPKDYPITHGSIYSAACQLCMGFTASWMDEHKKFDPVAYFFESGHKSENQTDAILSTYGLYPRDHKWARYHSHSFVDKRRSFGLQAADILAWSCTKEHAMVAGEKLDDRFFSSMRLLASDDDRMMARLVRGAALKTYFAELEHVSGKRRAFVGLGKRTFR